MDLKLPATRPWRRAFDVRGADYRGIVVVNGLSGPIRAGLVFGSSRPDRAQREELTGLCRRHEGGRDHCTAGERGSNPDNSEQRPHIPCPSDAIFVRKSAIDRPFINPPQGIVNGARGANLRLQSGHMVR